MSTRQVFYLRNTHAAGVVRVHVRVHVLCQREQRRGRGLQTLIHYGISKHANRGRIVQV